MTSTHLCEECGKAFTVCRFNAHHQKYCGRKSCARKRRRRYQSEYQNRRYRSDETFREGQKRKSRKYMKMRRERESLAPAVADPPIVPPESAVKGIDLSDVVAGVVAQLTAEDDPQVLAERLRGYASRGRQLCRETRVSGASP